MELPSYFSDFLKEIRPTKNHIDDYKTGHKTLRARLLADESLSRIIVNTFLQGSYRRATAIRPKGDKRADVDIVVVTKLSEDEYTPDQAMEIFVPFLDEFYKDKYEFQGRSIGISLSYVDLDLVITSAPSEAEIGVFKSQSVLSENTPEEADDWRLSPSWVALENRTTKQAYALLDASRKEAEWKLSPLHIPDREAQRWQRTHPIEQMRWTWQKNRNCNGHYVNVVKAIKWSRRINHSTPKYPKGYPLEHIIGVCCPDGIKSIAEGVTQTLENIEANYQAYALVEVTPNLPDHGVPEHNVFHRITGGDFAAFHNQICDAAKIARKALDEKDLYESAELWRELFGDKFPEAPPNDTKKGGYTPRIQVTTPVGGRFA